jgi:transcriptional regulator of heat shock response
MPRAEILKEIEESAPSPIVHGAPSRKDWRPASARGRAGAAGSDPAPASNLLEGGEAAKRFAAGANLFDDIERKNDLIGLLELARKGEGVRVFIGSENKLFSLSGSSIVAAPYADAKGKVVGVIGVIGPTRLNYARIVPMVDYTARVVGRLLA